MKIYTDDAPVLHQRAAEVSKEELGTPELLQLIKDMLETMRQANGVGIAAPQVGVSKRIFIADNSGSAIALINPVFTSHTNKMAWGEEGCLSVPGKWDQVKRYHYVTVEALSFKGDKLKFEAADFFARVLQHEMDHLDGILFIDRIAEQNQK